MVKPRERAFKQFKIPVLNVLKSVAAAAADVTVYDDDVLLLLLLLLLNSNLRNDGISTVICE